MQSRVNVVSVCSCVPAGAGDPNRGGPAARCPTQSSGAASDVSLAAFGVRIIQAIQLSAARGKTAEGVANPLAGVRAGARLLRLTVRPGWGVL